jgi:hypothetical protein
LLGGSSGYIPHSDPNSKVKAALNALLGGGLTTVLRDHDAGHLFGNPCVIVHKRGGSAFVLLRCVRMRPQHGETALVVERRPWGWANVDKEFLNPESPAVDRYAQTVLQAIKNACEAERQRRERNRFLRLQEREAVQ